MAEILIQGILCKYRDKLPDEEVLYSDLPQDEQYFRRVESPFTSDDQLIEIASEEYENRKSKYNKLQQSWVEREEFRMTYGNGVYAMINGVLTYIPASYWGYINHWILEHGEKPDYREADRSFFLFMEYLCFETDVLCVTRGKGRRQGATSLGFYWTWWICGRTSEKRGGSISFNDDAANKNFQTMFMRGFKAMLPCFVRDFDSKAEKFVRFIKPVAQAARGVIQKREGLNSYCDYLPNNINSYDSGRVSFLMPDETGKYEKMDINTYWSKVSPTLKKGKKKVGFAYMPTTVNPKKKGGENYRKFWDQSNQNAINPNTGEPYGLNTAHKVVRYLVPAYEGYEGCIDKFGKSIIDDPLEPIMGNDGLLITEGAKTIILRERALKEGEQLMEHQRDFPLDEYDMFAFESGNCEFNAANIIKQKEWIADHKQECFLRRVRLFEEKKEIKSLVTGKVERTDRIIKFMDDPKGGWLLLERPTKENNFKKIMDHMEPQAKHLYQIGVDTVKNEFALQGSRPTIMVMKQSLIVDGEETGMYPVALYDDKARLDVHFDDEVLKACMWYGCSANYEGDARTDFYRYFWEKGADRMLEWTPKVAQNPAKYKPLTPFTLSADPFQMQAQLQTAKMYIDGTSIDSYNGHVHRIKFPSLLDQLLEYDHAERTKSDQVIAMMMSLLPMMGRAEGKQAMKDTKPKSYLPTYKIKMTA